jgi:hypothetical protein
MQLQTNFPEDINKNLKLAKALTNSHTLQEALIEFCRKELPNYVKKLNSKEEK